MTSQGLGHVTDNHVIKSGDTSTTNTNARARSVQYHCRQLARETITVNSLARSDGTPKQTELSHIRPFLEANALVPLQNKRGHASRRRRKTAADAGEREKQQGT